MPCLILSVTSPYRRAETAFRSVPPGPVGLCLPAMTIPARAVGGKNPARTSSEQLGSSCCARTQATCAWLWEGFPPTLPTHMERSEGSVCNAPVPLVHPTAPAERKLPTPPQPCGK